MIHATSLDDAKARHTILSSQLTFHHTFSALEHDDGIALSYPDSGSKVIEIRTDGAGQDELDGDCRLLNIAGTPLVCFSFDFFGQLHMCLVDRYDPRLWELLYSIKFMCTQLSVRITAANGTEFLGAFEIEMPFPLSEDVNACPFLAHVDVARHVSNLTSMTHLTRIARMTLPSICNDNVVVSSAVSESPMRGNRLGQKLEAMERKQQITAAKQKVTPAAVAP